MAINTLLNKDPFATGGVMDAPDKAVVVAMNKIALGMPLTQQELGRLATRQRLEEQSMAVASNKASYQGLIGGGPIDVKSYTGSMYAGADPFSNPANAALESRFGKRAPGQIDISYGGNAIGAPKYTPNYAPTTGLIGQAQGAQYDARAAQAPTNYPAALGGQSYGIGANPVPQTSAAYSPAGDMIGKAPSGGAPNAVAAAKPEVGIPTTAPIRPPVNQQQEESYGAPVNQQQEEGYGGIMGLIESLKGIPMPSADRIGEVSRNIAMLPATVANYIAGGSRRMREGMAERKDILSGDRAVRNQSDEEKKKFLFGIDKEIQGLLPSAGQAGASSRIDYLRLLREKTVGSTAGSIMKLPGEIGAAQNYGQDYRGPDAQGYGQDYREPAAQVKASPVPQSVSQQFPVSQKPATAQSVSMDDLGVPSVSYGSNVNVRYAPNSTYGISNQGMDDLGLSSPAIQNSPVQTNNEMSGNAPAAIGDNRPTRIYAFGSGDPIGKSPQQQAKEYSNRPSGTTVSGAIASSPAQRTIAMREAEFKNTVEQQTKKNLVSEQKLFEKGVSDSVALNPNIDISSLPERQQASIRVNAALSRKKAGLDEKDNSAALAKSIEESKSVPAGPERIVSMISSYISNKGNVTPEVIKFMEGFARAPINITKIDGMTIVETGNVVRVLDDKLKPFDVNRADKEKYVSLSVDSADKYPSWDALPKELKTTFIKFDKNYPTKNEAGMPMNPREIWEQNRGLMVPKAAAPAKTTISPKAGTPTKSSPAAPAKGTPIEGSGGWFMK